MRLARVVGTDRAKELILTGTEVDGERAERIGLVHRCVDDSELATEALAMATAIAAMPRRGVRATMAFLALQEHMDEHEALRWATLTPELVGLELRPFGDAAERFERRPRHAPRAD